MQNELRNFDNFSYVTFGSEEFLLNDLKKGFAFYDISENITIKLYPNDILNISSFYDFYFVYPSGINAWVKGLNLSKKVISLSKRGFSPKNILFENFPFVYSRDGSIFLKKSVIISADNIKEAITRCDEAMTFYNQNLKEKDLLPPPSLTLEKGNIKVVDSAKGVELSLSSHVFDDFLKYFEYFILNNSFALERSGELEILECEKFIEDIQSISSGLQNILEKENADFHNEVLALAQNLYMDDDIDVLSCEE